MAVQKFEVSHMGVKVPIVYECQRKDNTVKILKSEIWKAHAKFEFKVSTLIL